MSYGEKKPRRETDKNNRLNLLLTIIFLIVLMSLYRLFNLQILKYGHYAGLASAQHQVERRLEPRRGRIMIKEKKDQIDVYYPAAVNKKFALLYADPRLVDEPDAAAEKLYEFFDAAKEQEKIFSNLRQDPYFAGSGTSSASLLPADQELFQIKYELEAKKAKDAKIAYYLEKLDKPDDPFEPLQSKVEEEKVKEFMTYGLAGLDYYLEDFRFYPEKEIGGHLFGFVSSQSDPPLGQYGLEGFFNDELSGRFGNLKAEKDAFGQINIASHRELHQAVDGSDLYLTLERPIQFFACRQIKAAVEKYQAKSGSIIVMQPQSGAILAMCSAPDYDPNDYAAVADIYAYNNPVIFDQWEPGSIMKPLTMAAALDLNAVKPESTYLDKGYIMVKGWPKPIKNSDFDTHGAHGLSTMSNVLEFSLNTGAVYSMEQIGAEKFSEYVKAFGFGEKTGVELETEAMGDIGNLKRKTIRPVEAATATFGQGLTVTALQMVTAFSAVANGGILMKPYLVEKIVRADNSEQITSPRQVRRVVSERTATILSGMMVNVIEKGHAKNARVEGYYLAGKTGTAQIAHQDKGGYGEETTQSFIGFGPVADPVFIALVKLDSPQNTEFAVSSAAPTFSKLAAFILDYYQIPKEQ